jgi:hypothetical protein
VEVLVVGVLAMGIADIEDAVVEGSFVRVVGRAAGQVELGYTAVGVAVAEKNLAVVEALIVDTEILLRALSD